MAAVRHALLVVTAIALDLWACEPATSTPGSGGTATSPSPPASAPPQAVAPYQTGAAEPTVRLAETEGRRGADAGSAPNGAREAGGLPLQALGPDEALSAQPAQGQPLSGVAARGRWLWRDVPPPPAVPELSEKALRAARQVTSLDWLIELSSAGRMRISFQSRALLLPQHTELLAAADRLGTILLWPHATRYRIVAPGALRTTVGERRVDVTLLDHGRLEAEGAGERLGRTTRKVVLGGALGKVELELAAVPEAGEGAPLVCRALCELGGIDPATAPCQAPELALFATFTWAQGGGVAFEITSLSPRPEMAPADFAIPPEGARQVDSGVPSASEPGPLSPEELAALRSTDRAGAPTASAPAG
ncbi:MAG: hypothetical protein HY744_28450 [Deltaproteobacteria bacterium]|nr:hypothetical protein [Deltaproteobacteria bacterium]